MSNQTTDRVAVAKQNAAAKIGAAAAATPAEPKDGQSAEYFRKHQVKNAQGKLVPKSVVVVEEKGRLRSYWAGPEGSKPQLISVEGPPMLVNPKGNMTLEGNAFYKGENYTVARSQAKFGIGFNKGLTTPAARTAFGGIADLETEQVDYIEFVFLLNKAIVRAAFYCTTTNEHLKKGRAECKALASDLIAAAKRTTRAALEKKLKLKDKEAKDLAREIDAKACQLFIEKSRKLEGNPATKNDDGQARDPMVWLDHRVYSSKWSDEFDDTQKGPNELELPVTNENMQKAIATMARLGFKYHPIVWRMFNSKVPIQAPKIKHPVLDVTGRPTLDDQRKPVMREDVDYEYCPATKMPDGTPVHSLASCKQIWGFSIYQGGWTCKGSVSGAAEIYHRTEQAQSAMSTYNFAGLPGVDNPPAAEPAAPEGGALQALLDAAGEPAAGAKRKAVVQAGTPPKQAKAAAPPADEPPVEAPEDDAPVEAPADAPEDAPDAPEDDQPADAPEDDQPAEAPEEEAAEEEEAADEE